MWQEPLKPRARLFIRVQGEIIKAAISEFFYLKVRKRKPSLNEIFRYTLLLSVSESVGPRGNIKR